MNWPRVVLHVDMDAFYAAIEVLDRPELRGKPVIVGGTPEGHGVVATASYEARRFGIHSAMPAARAVRLCPHGIFVPPRMKRYGDVSRIVMSVLGEFSPELEQISVDEAFLDVTASTRAAGPPPDMARAIKRRIHEVTGGLTASVGVASNKFVAKVASDLDKPGGLVVVEPGREREFLAPLPVERIWGVGPRAAENLHARGYTRIAALQAREEPELVAVFGQDFGRRLYHLSRGEDTRAVVSRQEPKSVSAETTLGTFLAADDHESIDAILLALSEEVSRRMRRQEIYGQTLTLKVRDDQFSTRTRSVTLPQTIQSTDTIYREAVRIFRQRGDLAGRRVRLLGVGLSQLTVGAPRQLDLLEGPGDDRSERVEKAVDAIRERLGDRVITRGRLLRKGRRGGRDSGPPS